jgi:hypothetical protein
MRDRWLRIGSLAVGLFLVNVAARLVARFGFPDDAEAQDRISLAMFAVIALVLAVLAFGWGRRHPFGRLVADLAGAVLIACALTVFVGPLLFGDNPFAGGPGEFFLQIWLYAGFAAGGVALGYLLLVALGRDYRSRQLARIASGAVTRPRKVVRR